MEQASSSSCLREPNLHLGREAVNTSAPVMQRLQFTGYFEKTFYYTSNYESQSKFDNYF